MSTVKIELDDHQIEYLKKVHVARAIRELTKMDGWRYFQEVVANMIGEWEDQHLAFSDKANKDTYFHSGIRLNAARQFAKILTEEIAKRVSLLEQPLKMPDKTRDIADFDGDPNRNGDFPEGE